MTYYYGTSKSDLKDLKTTSMENGRIYLTTNRMCALVNAAKTYIDLFINKNFDYKEYTYFNICENLFEKIYKDKIGYIYSIEANENDFYCDAPDGIKPIMDSYYTLKDVTFTKKEKVNIYEEFLKLKERGNFSITEKNNIPKKYLEDTKRYYNNKYNNNYMTKDEIEFFNKYIPDLLDLK